MTSRTPIRLTPYRGPLATPSTSPDSSPTSSTPPTDISYCSTPFTPTLDIAMLQQRISTLSPVTPPQFQSHHHRRRRKTAEEGLFGRIQLSLVFENLVYSAWDLANTLAWIVTFCLLLWGLLEWSAYASEPSYQPSARLSSPQFSLSPRARDLTSRVNTLQQEPNDQRAAVLQFLSEQIRHAKALSSLSASLGSPLRAFLEVRQATIPRAMPRPNFPGLPYLLQEADIFENLTHLLDTPLLDFTSGSFIGRNFALALDELDSLISEPVVSRGSSPYGEHLDTHLHAIFWRTTSNLLLEYSAASTRAKRLQQHARVFHRRLPPLVQNQRTAEDIAGKLNGSNVWQWRSIFGHSATTVEDGMQAFMAGLEITLDNVDRLVAYLDWTTEQLVRTTLKDVLSKARGTELPSCSVSLQELFTQSRPSQPKKRCSCPCRNDWITSLPRQEKVDITVPGSPTVRTGR